LILKMEDNKDRMLGTIIVVSSIIIAVVLYIIVVYIRSSSFLK